MPNIFRNFDWMLFFAVSCLIAVGLITLWSLSPGLYFIRQLLWVATGFIALFIFATLDYRVFRNHSVMLIAILLSSFVLLIALFLLAPRTRGVVSWFRIGSVAFEPVEFLKLVLILVLAKYFSRRHIAIYQIRHLIISSLYVIIPTILVLLQPDLGSAIILVCIWLAMVSFSGIKFSHLFATFMIFIILAAVGWFFVLAPYQKLRITSFLDPYRDPRGAGYNAIQAMIAVGSGQLSGKGIGYGTQSHLNFLPEAQTDFIFSSFAEETGLLGSLILILFLIFFLWRALVIGLKANDNFSKLYVLGFSGLVFSQSIVHIGINLGILPVTGITLPFISYGGSSLVSLLVGVGILESIHLHSRRSVLAIG